MAQPNINTKKTDERKEDSRGIHGQLSFRKPLIFIITSRIKKDVYLKPISAPLFTDGTKKMKRRYLLVNRINVRIIKTLNNHNVS